MKWLNGTSVAAAAAMSVVVGGMFTAPTAAQANTRLIVPEEIYRLCDRSQFTRSEIRKIQQRSDYELILRFTADQCAGVASVLGDGATASLPGTSGGAGGAAGLAGGAAVTRTAGTSGGAAQCVPGLGLANSCDPICDRKEFTTREIRAIQRSEDFPAILEWTLDACPAVAAVLTNTATATTATEPDRRGEGGGGGTGGGGTGGGGTGGGGTGGGGTGGGDNGGGDNGGGDNGGGDNGGGGNGGGGNGGGDNGGGGNGGGGNGGGGNGGSRPPEPDSNTDPSGYDHWRDTYGPGSGWNTN